jgi:two-component system, cell cycle response regulator
MDSSTAKILVVDDEPLNLKLIQATLSSEPYIVLSASNGTEALEKARSQAPDLVLLDIMMPGLNGYQVTEQMKSDPLMSDIPIILITALDSQENKILGIEVGADEFLNKPISAAELQARVRSLLRLRRYRQQLKIRVESQGGVPEPESKENGRSELHGLPFVLLVEDDEKDARLIQRQLQGQPYKVQVARTGEEAVSVAQQEQVDIILLDLLLPGMDGFGVLRLLKEKEETRNIQVVALTCLSDLETKVRGIETGVDDYLTKPVNIHELRVRMNALIKKKIYLDKLQWGYHAALQSAMTDKLTGLYNGDYFRHFMDQEIKRSSRHNYPVALLMIDINDFKQINDTRGPLAGDEVLKGIGALFRDNIREIDLGARFGGGEFAVVLPHVDRSTAVSVGRRLNHILEKHAFPAQDGEPGIKMTVSIGISVFPTDASSLEELTRNADNALHRAQQEGKNRVCAYE